MLFIVGKVAHDFRDYLEGHQIAYGQFAPPDVLLADQPNVYPLDCSSLEAILDSLHALNPQPDVSSVIVTGYEHYVVPAAVIAEHYGVPGMSLGAALAATDKLIMREKFALHSPSITPDFAMVTNQDDIMTFMSNHTYPVILKPANLMKSLFVNKCQNLDELLGTYNAMMHALPDAYMKYGLGEPRVIVEECLQGSMHTIAGFVDSLGNLTPLDDVVDCVTAQDLGKDDNYLFSRQLPSKLGAKDCEAVKQAAAQGVAALGLTNTPIHAELMLTSSGPKIIEIGARMGGYRPRMYGFSRGIDMYQASLDVATEQLPQLVPTANRACAVLEIFADHTGNFAGVDAANDIKALASYQYLGIKTEPGSKTGRATDGFRAPLVVVLGHDNPEQVTRDATWVQKNVTVATDTLA